MRRQSDDYMAILIENRLAQRRQAQLAARASRPVFRLLNASEILQFAAPALDVRAAFAEEPTGARQGDGIANIACRLIERPTSQAAIQFRNASMGSCREARMAEYVPDSAPIAPPISGARKAAAGSNTGVHVS